MDKVVEFLEIAKTRGFLDNYSSEYNQLTVTSGADILCMKFSGDRVLLWGNKQTRKLYELGTNKLEACVIPLVVSYFAPPTDVKFCGRPIKSASIFPTRVVASQVEFSDSRGKRWLTSGSDIPNITLQFFSLLHNAGGESLILTMPGLYPADGSDEIKASLKLSSSRSAVDISLSDKNLFDGMLIPSATQLPIEGYLTWGEHVFSKNDAEPLNRIHAGLRRFFSDSERITASRPTVNPLRGINKAHVSLDSDSNVVVEVDSTCEHGRVAASYKLDGKLDRAMSELAPLGCSWSTLKSGVNITGEEEIDRLSAVLAERWVRLIPIPSDKSPRLYTSHLLSGAKLRSRLEGWGIEDKDNVFVSMKCVEIGI